MHSVSFSANHYCRIQHTAWKYNHGKIRKLRDVSENMSELFFAFLQGTLKI